MKVLRRGIQGLFGPQAGFTLIELLIALAIVAAMGGAAVIATYQLLNASQQANDEQLIISQLRNAEHYVARDVLSSQTITLHSNYPDFPGFDLVLYWESLDGSIHTVTYTLTDSASTPTKELVRHEDIDGVTKTLRVADYLADGTRCSLNDSTVTMTLVATYRGRTDSHTFEAKRRPDV